VRQVIFGPHGTQLYLREIENHVEEDGTQRPGSYRLARIDLARGVVAAEWRPTEMVYDLQVSPDGRDLYLFQPAPEPARDSGCESSTCPYVFRRLDADSLAVVAERPIVGHRQLVVRPARPAGADR